MARANCSLRTLFSSFTLTSAVYSLGFSMFPRQSDIPIFLDDIILYLNLIVLILTQNLDVVVHTWISTPGK